jgi:hypothetical protein
MRGVLVDLRQMGRVDKLTAWAGQSGGESLQVYYGLCKPVPRPALPVNAGACRYS